MQAVSCDEAFLDMTGEGDPNQIATTIRQEIFDMTKCTASAGIAGNMLLARLATRKAKPNGQFYIPPADVLFLTHFHSFYQAVFPISNHAQDNNLIYLMIFHVNRWRNSWQVYQ